MERFLVVKRFGIEGGVAIAETSDDITALIRCFYRSILRRDPDPGGLDGWVSYLKGGGSIEHVVRAFLDSPEYRQKVIAPVPSPPSELPRGVSTTELSIVVVGNCQGKALARCIQALTGCEMPEVYYGTPEVLSEFEASNARALDRCDLLIVHPYIRDILARFAPRLLTKVLLFPSMVFSGFHPDSIYVRKTKDHSEFQGPAGPYHSSIVYFGWRKGKSVDQVLRLFNEDVYRVLGFFEYMESASKALLENALESEVDLSQLLVHWRRKGCFMHSINHPKQHVIADIAIRLLEKRGISVLSSGAADFARTDLAEFPAWPVYPEIAEKLGIPGSYLFRLMIPPTVLDKPILHIDLRSFVEQSFEAYSGSTDELYPERNETDAYRAVFDNLDRRATAVQPRKSTGRTSSNPYSDLGPHHFWRTGVVAQSMESVDPVLTAKFRIASHTRVATAGSCFAQYLAARLRNQGRNYLITESPPSDFSYSEIRRHNYGIYSARFGNLYSARQLLQLLQRAYGKLIPRDNAWIAPNGRYIDPFRPEIEPDGFTDIRSLEASRLNHLAAVRQMFESLDVFIFTLGLTEVWRAKVDGAVFPLAPAVVAEDRDAEDYEFVNFTATEVITDLDLFITSLSKINPNARVILTVSPVPLVATFEDRHVLYSTTYSKSVLRVAAEEISKSYSNCAYFPAYEVVTGNFNRGEYYGPDLRSITPQGVDHVMRLFFKHFVDADTGSSIESAVLAEAGRLTEIVCEEERLDSQP